MRTQQEFAYYWYLQVSNIFLTFATTKGSKIIRDNSKKSNTNTQSKYIININHKVKNTISNIKNRSVALMNSDIKFIINSNVPKESIGSILDQNTRIVTMGECDASISPNMFIDLDDVSAKHGSVIGRFKDDQIFYLMSKGISYNDSLKLLIKGYLVSGLDFGLDLRFKIIDIIDTYWRWVMNREDFPMLKNNIIYFIFNIF